MSEVQSRPSAPRGRGSARGGRGGFPSRGGRGGRGHATNGDKADNAATTSIEDDGEVGQLKKKHGSKVSTIKEMFPDWTDADVVMALEETDGDLETTVERIASGSISQWGEVSKKDRSKSKAKEAVSAALVDTTNQPRPSRGGRAGLDSSRGGRGRGSDRGRGGRGRGASVVYTNGTRKENTEVSVPTTELPAWDTAAPANDDAPAWETRKPAAEDSWGSAASTAAATAQAASSIIPEGVKKSWASMFAPVPASKKAPEPENERPAEPAKSVEDTFATPLTDPEPIPEQPHIIEPEKAAPIEKVEPGILPPSKDELTETNLEQVLDTSPPAPTGTAHSTAASSWDPRSATSSANPYSNLHGQPQAIRPPTSGFQASALKATGSSGRTASFQRRVLDQEEAVRMPGNREVDRTAVQFGAFNLGGSENEDVDGDREETETRAQPPLHSPAAPRASLPPVSQQPAASVPDTIPTAKQPAGLPAATLPPAAPGLPSPASGAQGAVPQGPQGNYNQYNRFPQPGSQEQSSLPQKPHDTFSQQAPSAQSPFDGYTNPQQSQAQPQQPQSGPLSSAPNDFSSYYTADPQQRQAYNNYYSQQYSGLQSGHAQPDGGAASQQRSFGGYTGPQGDGATPFPQSAAQQQQPRYATAGEGQNSGHSTPNPAAQSQQQSSQGAQPQPGHPQQPVANYPYGHPYYSSPYYAAYMNQFQQYGGNYPPGPYDGKGALHQQYPGYGMSPQTYDHGSSPASGAFGGSSLHGRDSALGGGLGDYGRGGSAQASTPQALGGSGAFGSSGHDTFARGSSFPGQNYGTQQGNQSGAGDDLKPFNDSKPANGPSPSLSQANRPGSATNAAPASGLPPPQSQQGGYAGYPAHLQQGHGLHGSQGTSQYSGLGGAGGHQAGAQGHQSSQYGGYGGFSGYNYGGNQQQRGGWGGNYGH